MDYRTNLQQSGLRQSVQGRVVGADGRPVAGAQLRVLVQGRGGVTYLAEGRSGPDGTYWLDVEIPRHVAAARHGVFVEAVEAGDVLCRVAAAASEHAQLIAVLHVSGRKPFPRKGTMEPKDPTPTTNGFVAGDSPSVVIRSEEEFCAFLRKAGLTFEVTASFSVPQGTRRGNEVNYEDGSVAFASTGMPLEGILSRIESNHLQGRTGLPGFGVPTRNEVIVPPTDSRKFGNSLFYPLSAVGSLNLPGSQGSAFLVGPRHVLTAAHACGKNPVGDGAHFAVNLPQFSIIVSLKPLKVLAIPATQLVANVISMYIPDDAFETLDAVAGTATDCERSTDFAVLVISWRMGDVLGVFKLQDILKNPFDPKQYPLSEAGVVGTTLQFNQGSCSLTETENCWFAGVAASYDCDTAPGHSGGPVFIWKPWSATAIAVHSGGTNFLFDENTGSAGPGLVALVAKAVKEKP